MTRDMHRLPASPDDLAGLRAARWVRESTAGQYDNWGPDAQAEQADRMIERYGLTESGLAWQSAASGRTVHLRPEFAAMLLAARAGSFDILVVGYVSRFQRNLKQTLIAVDELHSQGVAVLFCDERILSSDTDRWDDFCARRMRPSHTVASSAVGSARAWRPSAAGWASPVVSRRTATRERASHRSSIRSRPTSSGSGPVSSPRLRA